MEAELLAAARKGDKVKALSILKVEPLLFQTARDEAGNTVLHIATRAGKDEFVKSIVRVSDKNMTVLLASSCAERVIRAGWREGSAPDLSFV